MAQKPPLESGNGRSVLVKRFLNREAYNMNKNVLSLMTAILVAFTFSGCIVGAVFTPTECESDLPFANNSYTRVFWGPNLDFFKTQKPERAFDKKTFLKEWGAPYEIISISKNEETWIYKRKLWCGVLGMVVIPIPIPLLLPVCDGFGRITFKDDQALHINFRKNEMNEYMVFPIPGKIAETKACPTVN